MALPLRVLIVEDREDDVVLLVRELAHGGYAPVYHRVDTAPAMGFALASEPWDLVIADYAMPSFTGAAALDILTRSGLDIPFIIVSGAIGEETAVAAMKAGAHDYVMKTGLGRLVPAVRRELQEAEVRRSKRRSDEALREANRRLRALSGRMLEIQEAERRQLAHELHDEIGQALTAVKINLQGLLPHAAPGGSAPRIEDSIGIVDDALGQVRSLSLNLRPSQLDDLGLPAALRWYLDRQSRISHIPIEFDADGLPARLRPDIETACFRVVQEAVTNALRHGRPSLVAVRLECSEARLHLAVRDDGTGFDVERARAAAASGKSLGLLSMEERVALAGGRSAFRSAPGSGTEFHAWFDDPGPTADGARQDRRSER